MQYNGYSSPKAADFLAENEPIFRADSNVLGLQQ